MVSTRRPNECPRCGFAYTALYQPKPPRRSIYETRSLTTALRLPWQCRCGAWLRTKAWSFGWVDVAGIVIIATIQFFMAVRFWWVRNSLVFFIPIGVWFVYRTSKQMSVEEVPAPEQARKEIA